MGFYGHSRSRLETVPWVLLLLICGFLGTQPAEADTHFYAGAIGLEPGSPLTFIGSASLEAASGYYLPMVRRTRGLNAGYYRGDTLTFTALSASDEGTGQLPGRPLFGSRIAVEVVSVQGPEGGALQFWEGDGENPGDRPTLEWKVRATPTSQQFVISENEGRPGANPFGHIHGREFTTDREGRYLVGFRLVDVSTNGPEGRPLHSPSAVLTFAFQAGPSLESVQSTPAGTRVYFRSAPGVTNVLEASTSLAPPAWTPVAGPLRGNNTLQVLTDTNALANHRFFRLRLLNAPP